MEEKLNVAAILKDKPQGTKLYDLLYNIDVELDTIHTTDTETVVWCTNETDNNTTCHRGYSELGTVRGCSDGLRILLPSKEMQDWNKFAWKKGDVLVSNDSDSHIIFKGFSKNDYTTFEGKHWISVSKKRYLSCLNMQNVQDYHIEDNKDAAQTYINTIEENSGGKLNRETLEIEKQPEFKDGDIAFADYGNRQDVFVVSDRTSLSEGYSSFISLDLSSLTLSMGFRTSFFKKDLCKLRLATEEEKKQLFSALEKESKAWDSEKKQVVNLKPKVEFKPFDKVLCRNSKDDIWEADFFARLTRKEIDYTQSGKYLCVGDLWMYCIPYNEDTKHLLGTTDEWKGGEG
jgi:hypothetical protein